MVPLVTITLVLVPPVGIEPTTLRLRAACASVAPRREEKLTIEADKIIEDVRNLAKRLSDLAEHPETRTSPERQRGILYCANEVWSVVHKHRPLKPRKYSG